MSLFRGPNGTSTFVDKFIRWLGQNVMPAVALATLAILVAALAGAILLYDGAWFLFQVLDTHNISIPQLRISFALLQWPAVWVAESTGDLSLTRFVFSLTVMAMPPISIALCWWIVRKTAPWLIVWPALGIFLIDLPGQMHWIATSIRTNQLFWPILLAIFVGMPDRVVAVAVILLISALFMHPQVSAFFLAGAAAAAFLAWQRPEQRERLLGTALVLTFASVFRLGILGGGYEEQEASWSNQIGQWERSVLWLPLIALVATLIIGILLVLRQYGASPKLEGKSGNIILAAVAIPGVIALIIWASDPTLWRHAIDYRGPSMWHSLIIMGVAFLDVIVQHRRRRTSEATRLRIYVSNAAALVFCVVIALQSFTWHGELNKMRDAMAVSETGCIAAESLPGFEDSPLNFWSLPPASIGIQTTSPDYVILPEHLCNQAVATGRIPMDLTVPNRDTQGRNMNMFHLRSRVINMAICWSAYQAGWHDLEISGGDTRRWSEGNGVVVVMTDRAGEVQISGILDSLQTPNEVKIRVNGVIQRNFVIEEGRYTDLGSTRLSLEEGPNVIEFISMRPPTMVEGDPRELTIAVVNLEFRLVESDHLCVWQQLPDQYEDLKWDPDGAWRQEPREIS